MAPIPIPTAIVTILLLSILAVTIGNPITSSDGSDAPTSPTPWPHQFHSQLYVNLTSTGKLQIDDLWYDWTRGRNLNLLQSQLGDRLYDVEWDNKTSFLFTKGENATCRTLVFPVGVLRPNWLDGATYLGRAWTGGIECHLWTKVEFVWYYEEVATGRPVRWDFFNGMSMHVMTFEVGAVLEDSEWQAPEYCFTESAKNGNAEIHNMPKGIEETVNIFDYLHFRKFSSI
ncbi:hypothetical protein LUZ63_003789 [Rhynchospora breviuscula]|uniref:Uncharacterized protein n=1 Tax=Rhynchospora breviuscula TaxID=2022672 RepID=A0A9Q0HZQ6_9POAL|nr:hypothetical protein LUZ63_003789 [Rhynchospora breviuscula]